MSYFALEVAYAVPCWPDNILPTVDQNFWKKKISKFAIKLFDAEFIFQRMHWFNVWSCRPNESLRESPNPFKVAYIIQYLRYQFLNYNFFTKMTKFKVEYNGLKNFPENPTIQASILHYLMIEYRSPNS